MQLFNSIALKYKSKFILKLPHGNYKFVRFGKYSGGQTGFPARPCIRLSGYFIGVDTVWVVIGNESSVTFLFSLFV